MESDDENRPHRCRDARIASTAFTCVRYRSGLISVGMANLTSILSAIEAGDGKAANELLPLVYKELRRLAAMQLAQEKPGQTLDATGLVHEAYLRLIHGQSGEVEWANRRHFFAAAAEAMRRILIENARARAGSSAAANSVE